MRILITAVLTFALANMAHAGGYRVALQGQKALGMGHAGVAMSESAEVVFFNPGALTQLESDRLASGGITLVDGQSELRNGATTTTGGTGPVTGASADTDTPIGTPISGYYTSRLSDEMSWGLGIYTPYGSSVKWPTDWVGAFLVEELTLQAIYIQPTIGYQINEKTSVGFGPNLVIGSVELKRNLASTTPSLKATLKADNVTAWGFNAGLLHELSAQTTLGVSYRSEVTLKARDGDATFVGIGLPSDTFDADLPLPAELTLGLTHKINDKTLLAFDINRTYWNVYESLDIVFATLPDDSINARNYKDASIYRFGVQHQFDDQWTLRGGIYFDESPIQATFFAPETPRNDAIGYTFGATFKQSKNLELDFSMLLLTFDQENLSYEHFTNTAGGTTTDSLTGDYDSSVITLGFGVSYKY